MFSLRDSQQVDASIGAVTDRVGNPTTLQNPAWSSSDESILAVTPGADGTTATFRAVGPLGVASIHLDADADLGDGVEPIQGIVDVEVVAGNATTVNITLGTPTEQAPVVTPPGDGGGTTPPGDGGGTLPPGDGGGTTPPPDVPPLLGGGI